MDGKDKEGDRLRDMVGAADMCAFVGNYRVYVSWVHTDRQIDARLWKAEQEGRIYPIREKHAVAVKDCLTECQTKLYGAYDQVCEKRYDAEKPYRRGYPSDKLERCYSIGRRGRKRLAYDRVYKVVNREKSRTYRR